MKVLIVGGVAGGATAAARIRRLDENAEIIIFERSGYISYANCGLPYYIGGVIADPKNLTLQTPESFLRRFRIDVRTHNEVINIDTKNKKLLILNLDNNEKYEETYDKLLLSPGAKPLIPDLPGIKNSSIFTLRTVEDTFAIKGFVDKQAPKNAVIVGGGFIGLEMAENLAHRNIKVTVIQRSSHVLPPFDNDMASFIHSYLKRKGINIMLNASVKGFNAISSETEVQLECGKIMSDMIILAVGVMPETSLAKNAGLDLGVRDAIKVNDRMETSVKDIFAVGDAVEVRQFVSGKPSLIALAGPANKQARIAADNICGLDSHFKGSQGSSVIKLFDMTAASTGLNEALAKAAGVDYDKVITTSASHASYYPDATYMTIKTIFERNSGRILGAEIVGFDGVDKRCDVIAAAIRANMTGSDLAELELAYAPPYSSAKDPVNMAGFVIDNIMTGKLMQYHWDDVEKLPDDGSVTILDVRNEWEYKSDHINGAVNIPLDSLRERISELDKTTPLYVNCHSGLRSYLACRILMQNGFTCFNLAGGFSFYKSVVSDAAMQDPVHPCGLKK